MDNEREGELLDKCPCRARRVGFSAFCFFKRRETSKGNLGYHILSEEKLPFQIPPCVISEKIYSVCIGKLKLLWMRNQQNNDLCELVQMILLFNE